MAKKVFDIQEKIKYLELIKGILKDLDDKSVRVTQDFRCIGKKSEQSTDWKTGELLWEDEEKTIPKYDDEWGYVEKETLSEEDEAELAAIKALIEDLQDLC